MKRIVLVHTVKSVYDSFETELRKVLGPGVKINNILDDFLATDPADTGLFSQNNTERLMHDLKSAQMTGADLLVVTCSTLTPHVVKLRQFFSVPIVAIDDAMCKAAVRNSSRITVLATAESTVNPTLEKLLAEATIQNKKIELSSYCCPQAIVALKEGNKEKHDELVLHMAMQVSGSECIVLAQASMAHMQDTVQQRTGVQTFSSPRLCMQEIASRLEDSNGL
ncbi:hydantoin racemase [Sphaerochaeta pleomorpha str. Grapes]|uniref:Hydantoin racemase n=1 Tax=Sphaerochaeta pleomorpha (strain ATCC BAA-1885 / DSM 22778 / Grapes) TaxID=158190 RepID=G8QQF3_SPHPG|nr:aspartate/glutamate racemase family protein [Sphaerochaeta pleomorpha]AEV29798.1 hydantoin racemase [Sphaerochaeta pleomorpha str. Grapes]